MGTTWGGKKLSDFCTQYFMETQMEKWSSFNKPLNEFSAPKKTQDLRNTGRRNGENQPLGVVM